MPYSIATPSPTSKEPLAEYPELLQDLLIRRGITTREDAELFLNPDYEKHLHDPFLIKNMERAVERILAGIEKKEKIVIYSDYDCDGIPGATLLHDFFKKIGYEHFQNYIPHRHSEGYGLNIPAVEKLAGDGVTLMITVDVGITDVAPVTRANELGMDVIVTDHHLPGETLPPAYAVVNSKQEDDTYPFDQLCGSGVAFKLVQALLQKGSFDVKAGWEKWLLDVAGLATIADMVPLVGENRVIAYFGLKVLRKSPRPGLMKLCRKMNVKQREITEDDIGFMIAPRINAASRMDRPDEAFHLLSTRDEVEGGVLAEHLHKINNERKGVVSAMSREIRKEVEARKDRSDVIVIGNPKWKPALLGLVANTLVEEYGKTVCLWGEEGGDILKGSCRSDGSVNVVTMMTHAEKVLVEYGGHKFSGGFSVTRDKVHLLEETFSASYRETKSEAFEQEVVVVDKELSLRDVSWDTYRIIDRLAPFGEGNPKPLFLFNAVEIAGVKHFGKAQDHLELSLTDGSRTIPAISFFKTVNDFSQKLEAGERISLIAHIERSTFGRVPQLRLRIVDIV
jgi:single-stranded-DNA-specific exonuclease